MIATIQPKGTDKGHTPPHLYPAQKSFEYLDSVKRGDYPRPEGVCPKCSEIPPEFKLHDQRSRLFRFIEDSLVCVIEGVLVRYKCLLCKRTFTIYPDFVLSRNLRMAGATRLKLGVTGKKVRCRFSRDHSNSFWTGDFMHGPYVLMDGVAHQTYLFLFPKKQGEGLYDVISGDNSHQKVKSLMGVDRR